MKKLTVVIVAICFLMCCVLSGCDSSSKAAEKYIGVWYGYKVSTSESDIVFAEYASLVKLELTAEFASDGKYVLHYYVAGKEGEKYPQEGTYTMEGEKIVLTENNGVGEIINGELVLSFDNGAVKQYFKEH